MTHHQSKPRRAARVVRVSKLGAFTGNKDTMNAEVVKVLTELGLWHPYSMSPGGRARVIDEDEIVIVQDLVKEAGSLEALINKLRAEREAR